MLKRFVLVTFAAGFVASIGFRAGFHLGWDAGKAHARFYANRLNLN